jgi:hypothetical protein
VLGPLLGLAVTAAIGRTAQEKSSGLLGVLAMVIVWAIPIAPWLWRLTLPGWAWGIIWSLGAVLCYVVVFGILGQIADSERKTRWRGIGLCLLAFLLTWIALSKAGEYLLPQTLILSFAAFYFQQSIHTLILAHREVDTISIARYLVPGWLTLAGLTFLATRFPIEPMFHVAVQTLVAMLYRAAAQRSITELEARERAKVGILASARQSETFYSALAEAHASVLPSLFHYSLIALIVFDLPPRLLRSGMFGNVFEASLALSGIVVAFALFTLERGAIAGSPQLQQRILAGLKGIVLIFVVISAIAFIPLAVASGENSPALMPALAQMKLQDVTSDGQVAFTLTILAMNEALFFAVPMALSFVYAVVRDFLSDGNARNITASNGSSPAESEPSELSEAEDGH